MSYRPSTTSSGTEGAYSKLFVYAAHPNMRGLLTDLGVSDDDLILHDPSLTYRFDEVDAFRISKRDLYVSDADASLFRRITKELCAGKTPKSTRIFVSRLSTQFRNLLNERALIDALGAGHGGSRS